MEKAQPPDQLEKEKNKVKVLFRVNGDTTALIYLSEIYHIDLVTLVFLYEKYKKDLFFFFYMFAGLQSNHPKASKLLKILQFSKQFVKSGMNEALVKSEQERRVVERAKEYYVHSKKMYELETEVEFESSEPEITAEVGGDSGVAPQTDRLPDDAPAEDRGFDIHDPETPGAPVEEGGEGTDESDGSGV